MSLDWIPDELAALHRAGLHRIPHVLDGAPAHPRVRVAGRDLINLASNAYLGLADHPRLAVAAHEALHEHGTGSGASRLITGTTRLHRELEARLADLKGTEDAVLFATGYQANVATVPALVGPGDLVLSDRLNHASLIDAARLSRADVHVYDHADPDHLAALLEAHRGSHRRALVLTDGVFSMDGDLAPLPALARAAARHDATLYVDDAHATGVLGVTGAGSLEHHDLHAKGVVQMGTLSKALGGEGGFVAGSGDLCDWLRNRARGFVFSTAPSPVTVAVGLAALDVVRDEPDRRDRLRANAARLRGLLRALGLPVPDAPTPILPVVLGDAARTMRFAADLFHAGVLCPGIRPPTVPDGTSRLRVTVTAGHTDADLDRVRDAFQQAIHATEVTPSAPASS